MNLSNKLLKIEGEACGTRIVSSIHKVGDRYAFLDIGWAQDPAGNPFHYIGQMVSEKKDKWRFEDKSPNLPEPRSFVVTPITFADKYFGGSMLDDARNWQKFLEGKGIDEKYINKQIRMMEEVPDNVDIQ